MKFRKKPVVIDAFQWKKEIYRGGAFNWNVLPQWLKDAYEKGDIIFTDNGMEIKTLEGWHLANWDDFIIQGVKGEIYPCKPDIFEITYEPVEEK